MSVRFSSKPSAIAVSGPSGDGAVRLAICPGGTHMPRSNSTSGLSTQKPTIMLTHSEPHPNSVWPMMADPRLTGRKREPVSRFAAFSATAQSGGSGGFGEYHRINPMPVKAARTNAYLADGIFPKEDRAAFGMAFSAGAAGTFETARHRAARFHSSAARAASRRFSFHGNEKNVDRCRSPGRDPGGDHRGKRAE